MAALRVLFVSLSDDIGTDRLVSDMGRAGADCAVLGPAGCIASLPRCVGTVFPVPNGIRAAFVLSLALQRALRTWVPDRLVPLDDLAATLLRTIGARADLPDAMRRVFEASFGAPAGYPAACGRVGLMLAAERAGVRIPSFQAGNGWTAGRLAGVDLPAVVKRDQSSGSGGVVRVDTARERTKAIRFGWLKSAAKAQIVRLAGLGRPITPVLVQSVVAGRLAMYTAVCRDGRLIDGAGFQAVEIHPVKGSSTILRPYPHAEMAESARRLVATLGCSGFVSFDFIVDAAGRAFLIEMNPRPIGSAHLGCRFGHDLVHAFLIGTASNGSEAETRDVALFPKELERDPIGDRLNDGRLLHDVPHHEPRVVAAYLRRLQVEHPAYAAILARRCGVTEGSFGDSVVPSANSSSARPENPGLGTQFA